MDVDVDGTELLIAAGLLLIIGRTRVLVLAGRMPVN